MKSLSREAHSSRGKFRLLIWKTVLILVAGTGIGLLSGFSEPSINILLTGLLFGGLIYSFSLGEDRAERRLLIGLFLSAALIRAVSVLVLHGYSLSIGQGGFFFLDDHGYDRQAWWLAQQWRAGHFPNPISSISGLGTLHVGYPLFVASIYYLVGHNLLAAKLVNVPFSAMVPVFIYLIGRKLFNKKVAWVSAVFIMIYPNLLIWSGGLLKDTLLTFSIPMVIFYTLRWRERKKAMNLGLVALGLILTLAIRGFMGFLMGLAVSMYLWITSLRKSKYLYATISLILVLILLYLVPVILKVPVVIGETYLQAYLHSLGEPSSAIELGKFLSAGWVGKAVFLAKGAILTLLDPFAWIFEGGYSPYRLLYPGMWMWYLLIPYASWGAYLLIRRRRQESLLMLGPILAAIVAYILIYGGAGVRQRIMNMPVFLLLAGLGFAGANARTKVHLGLGWLAMLSLIILAQAYFHS